MKHNEYVQKLDEAIKAQNADGRYYSVVVMTETPDAERPYKITKTVYREGNPAHDCYSVAKSVTAVGLGILYDRGLVDVNDTLGKYLGKYIPAGAEKWNNVKICDVLHHSAGAKEGIDLDWVNVNEHESGDWLNYLFSTPIVKEPGREFVYSDGSYYIIGRIIEEIIGTDAETFIAKEVFLPLGFHQNAWSRDNNGHTVCGTGLYCRTEDLCKIAVLLMNYGVWNGKRIVSEAWVKMMEEPCTQNYGYGLTKFGENGIAAGGMFGQGYYANRKDRTCAAWHSFGTDGLFGACDEIGG